MNSLPLSRLSLNQATVRAQCSLEETVRLCAEGGLGALAVWRDKLAECGLARAARLIADSGLRVSGLCRGGLFTAATPEGRRAAIDDNRRAVDEAAALGAQCLVIVAGGLPDGSRDLAGAREMVAEGLAELLPHARAAGVPLAMEPLHPMYAADRACINTLAQALDVCEALGEGVGVAVDVYHVWWDPELEAQICRAGRRILAFHVCDWLVPTRDLLNDRGMMGDGVIDIRRIRGWVEAAGYDGPIEVEIFSDAWWKKPAGHVLNRCIDRFRTCV